MKERETTRFAIPLARVVSAFRGRTQVARERAAQRWAARASGRGADDRVERRGQCWFLARDAELPGGQTVGGFVDHGAQPAELAGIQLPKKREHWDADDRQRCLDSHDLIARADACRRETDTAEAALAMLKDKHGEWAEARGFKLSLRTLRRIRSRLDSRSSEFDANIDMRGRHRRRETEVAPEAWQLFLSLYLTPNKLSADACWRFCEGERMKHGWAWLTRGAIHKKIRRELPKPVRDYHRNGGRAFEADNVPKVQRDLAEVAAGAWWCLDGRTLDIMGRVPDSRSEWRRARFVLTIVLDLRSRMIVGWQISATENADAILAGIAMALRGFGAPADVTTDNGEAYKAAAGSRRGTRRQRIAITDPRIGSTFARLGSQVHTALPYHAWSKAAEAAFKKLKDLFDRWWPSFWGGSPRERPEGAERYTRERIDELPTADDLREAFAIVLDEYHSLAQRGVGTLGLPPKLVMDQFRGTYRAVAEETIELLCGRMIGPVKVGRDGVVYNHRRYLSDELLLMQGREVRLLIDPTTVDHVTVCDEKGTPLYKAELQYKIGASQEQAREAHRRAARFKRTVREYVEATNYLLSTPTTQILQIKREHAAAQAAEAAKQLPEPSAPDTTIVRPDLAEAARAVKKREQRRKIKAAVVGGSDASPQPLDPWARLAEIGAQEREEEVAEQAPQFDWADYYRQYGGGDADAREADGEPGERRPAATAG